jgi:hypothetical protein
MAEPAAQNTPVSTDKPDARPRKLPEARFRVAEQVRNIWNAVPEQGATLEALLDPTYWSHNARRMRPTDIIEAMPDDGSWYARLIVRSVGALGVTVALLDHYDFSDAEEPRAADPRFDVKWKGPHYKWAVVPLAGGEAIQTGFDTREAGTRWLAENGRELLQRGKAA